MNFKLHTFDICFVTKRWYFHAMTFKGKDMPRFQVRLYDRRKLRTFYQRTWRGKK